MQKIANEMGSKIYTVSRHTACLQSMDWGRIICIPLIWRGLCEYTTSNFYCLLSEYTHSLVWLFSWEWERHRECSADEQFYHIDYGTVS